MTTLATGRGVRGPRGPTGGLLIGRSPGADGRLFVPAGARFTSTDTTVVGDGGTGAMTVSAGGIVETALVKVGDEEGSAGVMSIDGGGASWTINGGLTVGNGGTIPLERASLPFPRLSSNRVLAWHIDHPTPSAGSGSVQRRLSVMAPPRRIKRSPFPEAAAAYLDGIRP